jgi:type II secretion system protein G
MDRIYKMMKRNNKGFTLVELMVVLLILGILVAIAIPIYNKTTDKAKEKACFANQRTIEGAAAQYRAEEEKWPENLAALSEYLQDADALHCPTEGGTYTLDEDTGKVTCTKHDHY